MLEDPHFEVMEYTITETDDTDMVVGITFSHINQKSYNGVVLGLDYDYLKSHDLYKQVLYRTRKRAEEIGCEKIYLGFTAADVKQKFGAIRIPQISMIQMKDHYNLSVLSLFSSTGATQHSRNGGILVNAQ